MIELHWDDSAFPTIVWQLQRGWSWEEFHNAIDRSWEMALGREIVSILDLIVIMPDELRFPKGSPFVSIGRGMRDIGKQDGLVVVVMANRYHYSLINMIRGALPFGDRLYGVPSLEAAREHIAKHRSVAVPIG